MSKPAAFALLALILTSCTPAAMEGLGRGLAQGATTSPLPRTIGLYCTGQTFGTITRADAQLSVTVTSDGTASGTFTNNGTIFNAQGTAAVRDTGTALTFSTLNLQLDSRTGGGANAQVGFTKAALGGSYGSTGLLTGTFDPVGNFTGTFKGIQGNYRTALSCRGA